MEKTKKYEKKNFTLNEFNDDYINEISSEIYRFNILPYPDEEKSERKETHDDES